MSVSVSMPQLGESVTEGTVTRWLKKEGERVEADEPLLEVSTDKVDTEIPSPASGILRGIAVDEDETVAVGAQLAVIEDGGPGRGARGGRLRRPRRPGRPTPRPSRDAAQRAQRGNRSREAAQPEPAPAVGSDGGARGSQPNYAPPVPASAAASPGYSGSSGPSTPAYAPPPAYGQPQSSRPYQASLFTGSLWAAGPGQRGGSGRRVPAQGQPSPDESGPAAAVSADEEYPPPTPLPSAGDAPYVTPLVRKLAAEHAVDLESVTGTGVGGRIRKQDVLEAARAQRAAQPQQQPPQPAQPAAPAQARAGSAGPRRLRLAPAPQQARRRSRPGRARPSCPPRCAARPSGCPGPARSSPSGWSSRCTSRRSSPPWSEADVTAIARLRDQARQDFEAREGVKLSFLPFFALAAVEALKVHPKLNAVIDGDQVTYHDAEHLGIAVDTERGLMVPVIHNAGDLNIGGLARKISDLATRTRSGQVAPDELAGGTFTLTNTGSRGALFDTPIINQPQVAILGTGTVVKRPVVVEDPALGEVIAVRSMVYLALTYDHRLVDGADAARFLTTVKNRLEEGAFEAELGL